MATVSGGSGALAMIEARLREAGVRERLFDLRGLGVLEERLLADLRRARRQAAAALALERALANTRFVELARDLGGRVAARQSEVDLEVARIDAELACRPTGRNLIFLPAHALGRGMAKARRRRLVREPGRLRSRLSAEKDQAWLTLQHLHLEGDAEAERGVARLVRQLALVAELRRGPEASGACAEEAVICQLSKLPDGYHVLNDVTVRPLRAVRVDGAWRQTAQLDHVVVGPAGVFVVETKNWGRAFTDGHDGLSPQQQVDAAARLCYRVLQDGGVDCRVRSIVASVGCQPNPEPERKVKVLGLRRLVGYIRWFEAKDDRCDVDRALRCLGGRRAA